ncbi:MAG TPA: DUF5916 domain-containing protein [Rubricoccaceae bacterium]|nr:DUF5916 domain-containing protein [Rubricoccaceae bacterium]
MRWLLSLACAGLVLTAPQARAQADSLAARPTLQALRVTDAQQPRIDGRLDDPVWAEAPVATDFRQRDPSPGAPSTERTEAFVLYDHEALYVGFRCFVRDPSTLVARLARRDAFFTTDRVSVDVDSYAEGRTAFSFAVTAGGVKQDILVYDDVNEDPSWDAVWEGAVARFEGGYTVEFRIPLAQLRYRSGAGTQAWGIQFQRDIPANGEVSFWAPILPDMQGYVSRFGRLEGLTGLGAPARVELMPYVAARVTRAPGDEANPFYSPNEPHAAVGGDLRVGLSSDLTLSATINPDFGQVEADPAVVNLTDFETFFQERRPFFVEGLDVFDFGRTRTNNISFRPTFFYTRRIGRPPSRGVFGDGIAYVEAPTETTIATAAKVSGRIGRWNVGLLDAITLEEEARFLNAEGEVERTAVEPLANYFVGRARRDFRGGASSVGGLTTLALRRLGDDGLFDALLPSSAVVGGLDFRHAWDDRRWTVSGVFSGSHVVGDSAAILRLQRASTRYYQRPDADHLALDPSRESLTGFQTELSIARTGGRHWRGSFTGVLITPGFEVNDLGFQSRADVASLTWLVDYIQPEARRLRRWNVFGFGGFGTNLDGDVVNHYHAIHGIAQFRNLWSLSSRATVNVTRANDRLTRGGPLAAYPADLDVWVEVSTDTRRTVSGWLFVEGRREFGGDYPLKEWDRYLGVGVTVRPSSAVSVSLEPAIQAEFDTDQFVTRRDDAAAEGTFGTRYVFADIRQSSFDVGLRLDWTFTPDLTLQLFARPFVTSGRYSSFKEFTTPGAFAFDRYGVERGTITPRTCTIEGCVPTLPGERPDEYAIDPGDGGEAFEIDNPDFNFRSLRGNAVLRWEYRPGSALFVVWQQVRDEFAPYDGFGILEEVGEVFRAPVRNVFLVKATYWFGL